MKPEKNHFTILRKKSTVQQAFRRCTVLLIFYARVIARTTPVKHFPSVSQETIR